MRSKINKLELAIFVIMGLAPAFWLLIIIKPTLRIMGGI